MAKEQSLVSDYEAGLDSKERELLAEQRLVLEFIDTDHKATDTKKHLKSLRKSEAALNEIMDSLLELKLTPGFREEADKLCKRCRELTTYTRDMNKALSDDLRECHLSEEKKNIDLAKHVGFVVATSGGFMTAVKNGVGDGHITIYQAGTAGIVLSSAVLARKKLLQAFKGAKGAVCRTPQQIRNSFMLYYVRETIKENLFAVRRAFEENSKRFTFRKYKEATRSKKIVTRVSTESKPDVY